MAALNNLYETIRINPERDCRVGCPSFQIVCGVSNSGKSTLVYHAVTNKERIFHPPEFASIVYMYKYPQPLYERLKKESPEISFVRGFRPDVLDSLPRAALVICDDLDSEAYSSEKILHYAKGACHHTNLTLILITQTLYHPPRSAKYAGEIVKQAKGFFLCQLVREKYALRIFSSQVHVGSPRFLLNAYEKSVELPAIRTNVPPHLFINFGPNIPKELRCVGNFVRTREAEGDIRARVPWVFKEMEKNEEAAKLYYLLSEEQLKSLSGEEEEEERAGGGDDNWHEFITNIIPAATGKYSDKVKRRAQELGVYFRDKGRARISDDGELDFSTTDGDTVTVGDALGVILYFAVPPLDGGRLNTQPRELSSLAMWLRHAPAELFAKGREPRRILRKIKKFYIS